MALDISDDVALAKAELTELREQGCDVWEHERRLALLTRETNAETPARIRQFLDELAEMRPTADFPYDEPSDLESIRAKRPAGPRHLAVNLKADVLDDRTLGAWQGRIAGCMLGKPVEGWMPDKIADLMGACGISQLDDYWPEPPENTPGLEFAHHLRNALRGRMDGAVRDDDIDYTIANLLVMERHGRDFTPRQVADFWLQHLPYFCTYTAERAAYRSFVNGIWPPQSARWRNPYREWIGAQIRADAFGYACPGRPQEAAELAYKDASISHTKNGIYGEIWVAAMLAAAFVADDVVKVIRLGLSEIPERCRLAEALSDVLKWHSDGCSEEQARENIIREYGSYHRVHTINNAAFVAMALLWGERDFSRTIGLAVRAGYDTDCNGATAGSVLGAMIGAGAIPAHWTEPLNDRVDTIVANQEDLTISGLATRTRQLQNRR